MDCSPPGSSVHGILQARILEWAAISFSRGLANPGIELVSPAWQVDSLPLSHLGILGALLQGFFTFLPVLTEDINIIL